MTDAEQKAREIAEELWGKRCLQGNASWDDAGKRAADIIARHIEEIREADFQRIVTLTDERDVTRDLMLQAQATRDAARARVEELEAAGKRIMCRNVELAAERDECKASLQKLTDQNAELAGKLGKAAAEEMNQ